MDKWSNKFNECLNCSTRRFPHCGRGYCSRCYPIVEKIEQVKLWDRHKPDTLKGFPRSGVDLSRDFLKFKNSYGDQYAKRLSSLKYFEKKLTGPISGLDLEYIIIEVANLSGADGGFLFGHDAGAFESHLDQRQRIFVYEKLHTILEAKKWKGIDKYMVFDSK